MVRRLTIKTPPVESSKSRRRKLCLVYVLSSLAIGSYLANLYLAEGFIFRDESFRPLDNIFNKKIKYFSLKTGPELSCCSIYQLTNLQLLLCKYVLGYSDLIFVPLVIILLEPEVRGGVVEVFRNKRAARERADSSIF